MGRFIDTAPDSAPPGLVTANAPVLCELRSPMSVFEGWRHGRRERQRRQGHRVNIPISSVTHARSWIDHADRFVPCSVGGGTTTAT
jgi:hypothetical protein